MAREEYSYLYVRGSGGVWDAAFSTCDPGANTDGSGFHGPMHTWAGSGQLEGQLASQQLCRLVQGSRQGLFLSSDSTSELQMHDPVRTAPGRLSKASRHQQQHRVKSQGKFPGCVPRLCVPESQISSWHQSRRMTSLLYTMVSRVQPPEFLTPVPHNVSLHNISLLLH